jgi:hypothetical protein
LLLNILFRHTADRLTSAEGTLTSERVVELQARVNELTSRLSHERKESVLGLEKEKANSSELRIEVGKLKARLEDTIRQCSGSATVDFVLSDLDQSGSLRILILVFSLKSVSDLYPHWIRIRLVDPDPYLECGSGYRRFKISLN